MPGKCTLARWICQGSSLYFGRVAGSIEGYIQEEKTPLPAEKLMEEENFVPPPLTISGITWGSSFPQAIINGKVVRPGDVIDDVQVISISKEGLVLSYKNQKFSLSAPGMNSVQAGGQNKQ